MKTIIDKNTKVSKYIFEDDVELTMLSTHIVTPTYHIGDMNSSVAEIIENITDTPQDWTGHKYTYDGEWKRSVGWMDIRDREITELKLRLEELEKGGN
tara:strand:+ start:787 stop:1080 length:294 start_codon:yes stop_codon:yes gene_type:complete